VTKSLLVGSPLAGWGLPLAEVPDPVFAERMAGDGLAIDPTGSVLHAPCDGEVLDMKGARHAVTIRSPIGIDILMHVGIDTVKLAGDGFVPLVATGARVSQGQPLMRFDLERLVRMAPSLITPVVLASPGTVLRRSVHHTLKVGDVLREIATGEVARQAAVDSSRRHGASSACPSSMACTCVRRRCSRRRCARSPPK
jgi:glucose-specific phosphotransferase system IIA component